MSKRKRSEDDCPVSGEAHCKCLILSPMIANIESKLPKDLKSILRKLFSDHVIWTRAVIESSIPEKHPSLSSFTKRLVENQKDIGDTLKPIIGASNGTRLTALLTEHISLAGKAAATLGTSGPKSSRLKSIIAKIFENSDRVGDLLSSLNRAKLPLKMVQHMFREHNQFVLNLATLRYKKNWPKFVSVFDGYYCHMLAFSDALFLALK